jgi:hypothetical protein
MSAGSLALADEANMRPPLRNSNATREQRAGSSWSPENDGTFEQEQLDKRQ